MSVPDDGIPHGLEGYRRHGCQCDDGTTESCLGANRAYNRQQRLIRKERKEASAKSDELARKREAKRDPKGPPISTKGTRAGGVKRSEQRSESNDSDGSKSRRGKRIGEMEAAVIAECAQLELAAVRPTVVVAARNLARLVDDLSGSAKGGSVQVSTTKQLMAMLESLRPKDTGSGKRKSGGRLATVGALTKVKRQA